jgi:hypothetical protein
MRLYLHIEWHNKATGNDRSVRMHYLNALSSSPPHFNDIDSRPDTAERMLGGISVLSGLRGMIAQLILLNKGRFQKVMQMGGRLLRLLLLSVDLDLVSGTFPICRVRVLIIVSVY